MLWFDIIELERQKVEVNMESKNEKDRKFKDFEELELRDDYMFNLVMQDPDLCKECLERIMDIKIDHITYPESQKSITQTLLSKSIRLDIYTVGDGTIYDIEMQTETKPALPKRSRYYQDMIDINNLDKGDDYTKLRQSVVIFICTFDEFKLGRHKYTFENRCVEEPELKLNDESKKIFLNTKGIMNDITSKLGNFLNFIETGEISDDYTNKLKEAVEGKKNDERLRGEYMTVMTRITEAEARGETRGEMKERLNTIKRMLSMGFDIDTIKEASGADDKDIRRARKEIYELENGNDEGVISMSFDEDEL